MSQVSYGTVTITDTTDITDIYFEYALAVTGAAVDDPDNEYTFSQTGELSWSDNYSEETGEPVAPQWISGYEIWKREVKIMEGIVSPEYGTPFLDTALNQVNTSINNINNQIGNLQTNARYFVRNSTGSIVIAGNDNPFESLDVSTYGFNSLTAPSVIQLRYNDVAFSEWSEDGLTFYQPPTISGSTVTQGNKTMVLGNRLGNSSLIFYNPADGETEQAVLDTNGLVLKKGGIEASEDGDYIYLSSLNKEAEINGHTDTKWRAIIGTKFGVTSEGVMYAKDANISGNVTIGDPEQMHLYIKPGEIGFYKGDHSDDNNKISYIKDNKLYIPYSVVLNEMQMGETSVNGEKTALWSWAITNTNNLRLVWLGPEEE